MGARSSSSMTAAPIPTPGGRSPISHRTLVAVGVAIVVVAVAAILILSATRVWPIFGHSSAPTEASSFGSWRTLAQDAANGNQAGSWNLVRADAALFPTPWHVGSAWVLNEFLSPHCTPTPAPGVASSIDIPGLANISLGVSYDWLYWFSNANGTSGQVVLVLNGAATVLGTVSGMGSGSGCMPSGSSNAVDASVMDSPTAAQVVGSAGAFAYLDDHPSAYGIMDVVGNTSWPGRAPGPLWSFEAVDCSPVYGGGLVAVGPGFKTSVDPLNGTSYFTEDGTLGCYLPP